MRKLFGVFGLILMLFVSGCSSDGETVKLERIGTNESRSAEAAAMEEALVGIWIYPQSSPFYEYREGGTRMSHFYEYREDGSYYRHYPYSKSSDNKNYYRSDRGVYKIVGPDKIDGYKLIKTLDNGDESEVLISVEEGSYTLYDEDPENPGKTLEFEYNQRITKDAMEDYFAGMGFTPHPLLASINDKKLSAKTIAKNKILTGVWKSASYPYYLDFKQDGTYYQADIFEGLYKVDGNKLILKGEDGEERELTFSVEGDVLVTNEYGDEMEFTRSTKEALLEYTKNEYGWE